MVDLAKLLKDIDDDIDLTEILGESPEFNLRCKVAIRELVTERDALKAELNDTKTAADDFFNTGRIWEQKLVDCQKSYRELTWENNRLKAELEATRNQEPCGWQSRFITPTETWGFCSKEHYETVKAAPHEYPGYEVRAVYASPVPAQQLEAVKHEYPMQPIFLDNGLPRFEKNPIIDWLCEKYGLNEIGIWWQVNNIERKYIEQLHRLS